MGLRFPLTPDEVMQARAAAGFVTPIEPIRRGRPWCVFQQRGTFELMAHPDDAAHFLEHGIVVDGKLLEDVDKVGEWPMIGAWQLVCSDRDQNHQFTPDERPACMRAARRAVGQL